jgi:hypothetical protein
VPHDEYRFLDRQGSKLRVEKLVKAQRKPGKRKQRGGEEKPGGDTNQATVSREYRDEQPEP